MKQLLFLLLFPCLCMAQYTGNAGQKITLGEQTTADGLVWRGRLADTANLLTNKLDTSVYIVLDTGTQAMWYYRASTTPKWTRLVDSLNNLQGQLSLTSKVTGVLPVANGGTGADMSSLPNNYLVRKNASGVFDTSAVYAPGGNVGIGTASPTSRIHVKGSGATSGTSALKVDNSGGTNLLTVLDNGTATFRNISNSGAPATSGTTVNATLSIDNAFSVMTNIGNLSDIPYSVWLQVQDKGNLYTTYPLSLQPNGGSVGIGTASPQIGYRLHVVDSIYVGGNVSASAYTTRSDYDLKDEIQNISYGINEVMQMQPVKYTYKSNGSTQLGFIAQDLGVITPEVVSFEDKMSVYYNALIPILTKAIQEQNALIKALEQRILILENK